MQHQPDSHHIVPYATHVKVLLSLLVLTVLTVSLAQVHLGAWNEVVAFAIATSKASLVLAFFMHLKYEEGLFRVMLSLAVVTLIIIFSLTFGDYIYR